MIIFIGNSNEHRNGANGVYYCEKSNKNCQNIYHLSVSPKELKPEGTIIFAVFNPEWVKLCAEQNYRFRDFDNKECIGEGLIDYGGENCAPVYVRTAQEYDSALINLGFKKEYEEIPPFTEEFKKSYPEYIVDVPEFLILGYSK